MTRGLLWAALAWGLCACGGEAVIDPIAAGGAGGSGTTSSTSTTTTTTTTTGVVALSIELVSSQAGAGCMPDIPPDPLYVDFILRLRNVTSQPASADLLGARIASAMGTTSFLVSPESSGPVPAQTTVEASFVKVPDSAVGTSGCSYCGANDLWLSIDVEVGGLPVVVEGSLGAFGCAF